LSHKVAVFAWCIQLLPHSHNDSGKASNPSPRVRVTCFWQHDLKAMWGASSLSQNLPAMVIGLVHTVRKRGERIPILRGWGKGVGLVRYGSPSLAPQIRGSSVL